MESAIKTQNIQKSFGKKFRLSKCRKVKRDQTSKTRQIPLLFLVRIMLPLAGNMA